MILWRSRKTLRTEWWQNKLITATEIGTLKKWSTIRANSEAIRLIP